MAAACSYWPTRSSSKPWPIAWEGSTRATRMSSPTVQLLLRRIQSPEILEYQAPLLRGEALQLLPGGVTEPRARARRAGLEDVGNVNAVPARGAADALLGLVGLVVRERATGVEQSPVQALLALDGLLVEAPGLELTRELLRLLREWTGGGARTPGLEPLELLREGALAGGEGAELLQHGLAAHTHQREQALGQTVQPLLIARQPRQLLHRFGEPAPRLPARHLASTAGHRVGPLLHCRLPRSGGGARLAAPQRLGHTLLPLGERGRFRQRPIERRERLAAPLPRQRVALTAQRLGHARHLLLGLRPGLGRGRRPTFARRLRRALHRRSGIADRVLRRGERRAGTGAEVRGHSVDAARQRVRAVGQRTLVCGARAVRPWCVLAIPLRLAPPQVLGVGRKRRERAFDRGPAEQLLAALELGLELLLRLGEALERAARRLRVEPRQGVLQLAQPRRQLRRHRTLQQLLDLAQPRLERRVVHPGGLGRARDLLHRPRQLLYPLLQRLLLPCHGLRPFRRLEGKRSVPPIGGAACAGRIAGPLLPQIPRPRPQLALRLGERVRRRGDIPRSRARRRAQLLEAREPQRDFLAPPHVRAGRGDVVPGLDAEPQRVARQQPAPLRVEIPLDDRSLTRARHVERLAHDRPHFSRPAHAPAHDLEPGQTVIVPRIDHERLPERQRQRRVAARDRQRDHGRGI